MWQAIDNHQVKPGMNELQASFAVGVGTPEGTGTSNPRIVNYQNDGHPLRVTFDNGKATEIAGGCKLDILTTPDPWNPCKSAARSVFSAHASTITASCNSSSS